jgi:hypothetical protein
MTVIADKYRFGPCVSTGEALPGCYCYPRSELLKHAGVPFRACLVGGGGPLLTERRQLAEQLEHADAFVLPSLEEGSSSLSPDLCQARS